jgi:hypothetical protein
LSSVVSPTQAWLTMNSDSSAPGAVMQFTFNTPVNAAAANQCGRVLFNEYHVIAASNNAGVVFPNECSASGTITPQEKMLEYALFDLSSFVQPVITPSLSIVFSPSPMVVNQGDSGDQVTIDITNTSSSVDIDASAVLTLSLPTGITATALSDATGGWICTLNTLRCTRTTSLASNASDAVTLTVSVPSYTASGLTSYSALITATVSSTYFSNNVSNTDTVLFQTTPVIHWPTPASIYYGTPLSTTQLNASALLNDTTVAGTYTYSPTASEVLTPGSQALYVVFTPSDTVHYTSANGSNSIHVLYTSSSVNLTTSSNPVFVSNAITFTVTVKTLGVTPTGSIVLYDGNTQIGTAALSSGSASITTTALATGTHQITAAYSGDTYYPAASSNTVSQLVDDFTITLTGTSSTTLNLGQSSSFPMTISPVVGTVLPGAISMTINGLPAETGSSLSPASLSAGVATSKISLTVTMAQSFGYARPLQRFGTLPVALGLALLPLAGLRRLRRSAHRWLALVVLGLGLATSLTACSFQYTPKSSTVTLTATSGNLTHTTSVQVTVQ